MSKFILLLTLFSWNLFAQPTDPNPDPGPEPLPPCEKGYTNDFACVGANDPSNDDSAVEFAQLISHCTTKTNKKSYFIIASLISSQTQILKTQITETERVDNGTRYISDWDDGVLSLIVDMKDTKEPNSLLTVSWFNGPFFKKRLMTCSTMVWN